MNRIKIASLIAVILLADQFQTAHSDATKSVKLSKQQTARAVEQIKKNPADRKLPTVEGVASSIGFVEELSGVFTKIPLNWIVYPALDLPSGGKRYMWIGPKSQSGPGYTVLVISAEPISTAVENFDLRLQNYTNLRIPSKAVQIGEQQDIVLAGSSKTGREVNVSYPVSPDQKSLRKETIVFFNSANYAIEICYSASEGDYEKYLTAYTTAKNELQIPRDRF